MVFKIVWTPRASNDFENLINYLEENWSHKVATDYASLLDQRLLVLKKMPGVFPRINAKRAVRKCVVSKHNSIFYSITGTKVVILSIFDTRQLPRKLNIK